MTEEVPPPPAERLIPLSLRLDHIAAMLNAELTDHPVYDGFELQWFDDDRHGTGMLAFLSRREDRRVDYYKQEGLTIDPSGYDIGGGTRSWSVIDFDTARLMVADDGVDAEVRFRDVDGRDVHIRVNDRDGRVRRRGGLLAPVGAAIEHPSSLLLVWMPVFDLVRHGDSVPLVEIDGIDARTGALPGARLHRHHLIKYAAPVLALQVNPSSEAAAAPCDIENVDDVLSIRTSDAGHEARLVLTPRLPNLAPDDIPESSGRWHVGIDGVRLTGGVWRCRGTHTGAQVMLDVDERWRPGRLPWLMRAVTTVIPVFRRWPTTYRWVCDILGPPAVVKGRWQRTGAGGAESYMRATRRR